MRKGGKDPNFRVTRVKRVPNVKCFKGWMITVFNNISVANQR